jgi:hypothetical protein
LTSALFSSSSRPLAESSGSCRSGTPHRFDSQSHKFATDVFGLPLHRASS